MLKWLLNGEGIGKWFTKINAAYFISNFVYPWGMIAQTYRLHTQDRRAFFEKGNYDFYDDAPKGFEKVNMFRRWIHEELLGEKRPMRKIVYQPPMFLKLI